MNSGSRVFRLTILSFWFAVALPGQPLPSADAIVKNFEQTFSGVQDFTASLEAEISMERLRIPKMAATVYFKRPDKVHYTSPGFVMLPREGMAINPSLLRERYRPVLEGMDTVEGRRTYRLRLTARDPKLHALQMWLWIDAGQWTASKLETVPYGGRKIVVYFSYGVVQERYWLPGRVTMQFTAVDDAETPAQIQPPGEPPRSLPRSGSMTIRYSNYRVNTGLSDDLFPAPTRPKP